MMPRAADDSEPEYWPLDYPRPGIDRIVMPGWALYDAKWDWRTRIPITETCQSRQAQIASTQKKSTGGTPPVKPPVPSPAPGPDLITKYRSSWAEHCTSSSQATCIVLRRNVDDLIISAAID